MASKLHQFKTSKVLNLSHISKSFDGHQALDDVSIHVRRGTVFGLLGPNGAGKTTLIRIANQILLPDSGSVLFDGHPISSADITHIGYLPEERGLYRRMRVGEQLIYLSQLKGMSKSDAKTAIAQWLERFGMSDWCDRKVMELSKGMQQKVQFVAAVVHRPDLLILDEPFSGFDPVNAALMKEEVLRLRSEGTTIVISSHNMASVESMCDEVALIHHARLAFCGAVADVKAAYGDKDLNEIFIDLVNFSKELKR